MATNRNLPALAKIAAGVAMILLLAATGLTAQDTGTQLIEVTAKKYEYSPSPIHVKTGSKVRLKFTAADHDHGFKIADVPDGAGKDAKPGLVFTSAKECVELSKGQVTTVEFVAETPGTYTFKCCKTCGLGHHGMKGQIVVDPA